MILGRSQDHRGSQSATNNINLGCFCNWQTARQFVGQFAKHQTFFCTWSVCKPILLAYDVFLLSLPVAFAFARVRWILWRGSTLLEQLDTRLKPWKFPVHLAVPVCNCEQFLRVNMASVGHKLANEPSLIVNNSQTVNKYRNEIRQLLNLLARLNLLYPGIWSTYHRLPFLPSNCKPYSQFP